MDMGRQQLALAVVVVLHLVVTLAHGWAHNAAAVPLGWLSLAFVIVVIQAARLIGIAMSASLLFGLINHFVIASPDHVNRVTAQWRALFVSTAILLALTEAAGAILGLTARRALNAR
jgi:hypothetical protein